LNFGGKVRKYASSSEGGVHEAVSEDEKNERPGEKKGEKELSRAVFPAPA